MLLRTSAALDEVKEHLAASGAFGTVIEAYLTQYLLVLFSAEMEEELILSLQLRAGQCGDPEIAEFVKKAGGRLLRSVKKEEIAGFVSMFDSTIKERMASSISDAEVGLYNAAILARHKVAHGPGGQITFTEFAKAVGVARKILACVRDWVPGV